MQNVSVQIIFDMIKPGRTIIRTNVRKEAVRGLLEAWLHTQIGKGEDKNIPKKKHIYTITIRVDLSYDIFYTSSDTKNKGLTCGIVLDVLKRLDELTINALV